MSVDDTTVIWRETNWAASHSHGQLLCKTSAFATQLFRLCWALALAFFGMKVESTFVPAILRRPFSKDPGLGYLPFAAAAIMRLLFNPGDNDQRRGCLLVKMLESDANVETQLCKFDKMPEVHGVGMGVSTRGRFMLGLSRCWRSTRQKVCKLCRLR